MFIMYQIWMRPDPSWGRFRLCALVLASGSVFAFCSLILEYKCSMRCCWLPFVPWWLIHLLYFKGDNSTTCDPWTSQNFTDLMNNYMVEKINNETYFDISLNHSLKQVAIVCTFQVSPECNRENCLPECEATTYSFVPSSAQLRWVDQD